MSITVGKTNQGFDVQREIIKASSVTQSNILLLNSETNNVNILITNNNTKNNSSIFNLSSSNDGFNILYNNNPLLSLSSNLTTFYSKNNIILNSINFKNITASSNIVGTSNLTINTSNNIEYLTVNSDSVKYLSANSNSFNILRGNLGIGTTNPTKRIDVNGDAKMNNLYLSSINNNTNPNTVIDINSNIRITNNLLILGDATIAGKLINNSFTQSNLIAEKINSSNITTCNINATQMFIYNDINTIGSLININNTKFNSVIPNNNLYLYSSNSIDQTTNPLLLIDTYGQILFSKSDTNIARAIIDINTSSNLYPSCNILCTDNFVIDKNGNIGIGTNSPINNLQINLDPNIGGTSLIGLNIPSDSICNYLTASSNEISFVNLTNDGKLTLGDTAIDNGYTLNLESNARIPNISVNSIDSLNGNINFNNKTLSNIINVSSITLSSSNLIINDITTTNITCDSLSTNKIDIDNLFISPTDFYISSSDNSRFTSTNVIISSLSVENNKDNQNLDPREKLKIVTGVSDPSVGLNISGLATKTSARVSANKTPIYELYRYDPPVGNNKSILRSFCEIGMQGPENITDNPDLFYITYGNVGIGGTPGAVGIGGTIMNRVISINPFGLRLYNTIQITPENKIGISLGGDSTTPILPTESLQVVGNIKFHKTKETIQSYVTLFCDQLTGNVGIGTDAVSNYKLNVNGKAQFSEKLYVDGSVGIGTDVPTSTLHVNGPSFLNGIVGIGTDPSETYGLNLNGDININGNIYQNDNPYIGSKWTNCDDGIYYSSGNIGIGTNVPLYKLQVDGDAFVKDKLTIDSSLTVTGTVTAGNIASTSDLRVKNNLVKINNALEKLKSITGYYYNRLDIEGNPRECGCIAQEVINIFPEIVKNNNDNLSISYGNMAGIFVEAFKDIDKRIKNIEEYLNI
jgi:hypothetical protein